jgi:hypothetical protein
MDWNMNGVWTVDWIVDWDFYFNWVWTVNWHGIGSEK